MIPQRKPLRETLHARFLVPIAICGMVLSGCGTGVTNPASSTTITGDFLERVTEKGPVKLVIQVSPKEPRLSDLVEMEIRVTAAAGIQIQPPTFGQAVGDFLVRDYGERTDHKAARRPIAGQGSTRQDGEANQRRFRYQLEPVHAGRHLIRSFAIPFVDNRPDSEQKGATVLIESEPIEINVTSELGDQIPNLADLEPMLPPRPLHTPIGWSWILGAVIVGLTAVSIIWWRRSKKTQIAMTPQLTPEEIAHAAFSALLTENLPSRGLFKEFYLRLTGIVRHFIEATTGLRAPEQTTEEFLRAIRSREVFSAERSGRLKEFLEAADMVKYAGQQPDPEQIELSIARAREFVDFRTKVESISEPVTTARGLAHFSRDEREVHKSL